MKAVHIALPRQPLRPDHLQGHDAVEAALSGLENDPHAAAGDFFEQFVVAEGTEFRAGARHGGSRFTRSERTSQRARGAQSPGHRRWQGRSTLNAVFRLWHSA